MEIWGMSTQEYTQMLKESFNSIRKATRKEEAAHYTRTRILASNLEAALERLRTYEEPELPKAEAQAQAA
ncbi:MAG: hypothetical protein HFJ65_08085 [Eggerthellaceae bacterium]|nr:hypothetical protein [Eggerthellaceae bacterium]